MSEIDNWGEPTNAAKQKDALIRELMDGRHRDLDKMREMKALIRELVAALERIELEVDNSGDRFAHRIYRIGDHVDAALIKAKAAGFTSTQPTTASPAPAQPVDEFSSR